MYLPTRSEGLNPAPRPCQPGSNPLLNALMLSNAMITVGCAPRRPAPPRRRRSDEDLLQRQRRSLGLCIWIEGQHVLLDVERRQVVDILLFEFVEPGGVDSDVFDARKLR